MLPLVSVIMPAYNAEKYIGSAIESILNQTYVNWELIIVEDCSTDHTLNVIKSYWDSRIMLLQNESNRGISYATNRGLDHASGKYIALLDDDDIAAARRLEIQVDFLEKHEEMDILGGRSDDIDKEGKLIRWGGVPRYNTKYIKAVLLFKCVDFLNGTTMMRKKFVDENCLRYQEKCYGMQDYKFFIDSSKVGNISAVGDLLLYHRIHDSNETKRCKQDEKLQRKRVYAEFQRESLKVSGYKLDEEKMAIINKALAEDTGRCENRKELQLLYEAFSEIIHQAHDMKVDYNTELEQYCKRSLAEQVKKMISF